MVLPVVLATAPARAARVADPARAASSNPCPAGGPECVDADIASMRARFALRGTTCDHHAAFTLAYLRTTQAYRFARDQPGFFDDPAWVNHEGAVFASFYYRAADDYAAGDRAATPAAWRGAFDAASGRKLSGVGDLLLGMNAHINRDLPYVLAQVGLTRPDGTSRKPDHDKVNVILAGVLGPLLAEETARFDRTGFDVGISPDVMLGVLVSWREQAWQNAVRLVTAPNATVRALVSLDIDATAAAQAALWSTLTGYFPPFTTTGPRDAYCARHNADAPPQPYAFGTPPAY
jgi:hypothetical protein